MRLFTGIDLPEDVRERLERLLMHLRPAAHLTLARIKGPVALHALRTAIEQLESVEFGNFQADRFYLFRSHPGAAGSIYTKLSEYPFQAR